MSYDASSLSVLEGLDAVRKRPGMYIGSTDSRGLQHLLWEIVDNSVDEALAGHADTIEVTVNADGSITVADNGRGIPVDVNPATGKSGVVLVLTELHAGGKFGAGDGGYKVSGGLHGVGSSVVNAMSSRMDVEVRRDGKRHHISFNRGVPGHFADDGTFTPADIPVVTGKVAKGQTGTTVTFMPDRSLFTADARIETAKTLDRARNTAFLVPGLTLSVVDHTGDSPTSETFRFDNGLADFCDYLTAGEQLCDVIRLQGDGTFTENVLMPGPDGDMANQEVERTVAVDVALRWENGYDTRIESFANVVHTTHGGTHQTGFERALSRVVAEVATEWKVAKKDEDRPTKDDIQEGLVAVVAVQVPEPQFEGQTKSVLGTPEARAIVQQVVADGLRDWFATARNKSQAKLVATKAVNAAKARLAARKQRETARRKSALESSSLPAKLADCRTRDVEVSELFLVEGDSAMGTAKMARSSEFQALLPLKGKVLNTHRATRATAWANDEVAAIISVLGTGIGKDCDLANRRYSKIVCLVDADVDGSHIRTLLLTLFARHLRPWLDAGMVYAAQPPLFGIAVGKGKDKQMVFCIDEAERDRQLARLKSEGVPTGHVSRFKGLGEMSAEQLALTALDPATRVLRRITVDDADRAAETFDLLMGTSAAARRDFIFDRAPSLDRSRLDV